MERLSPTAKAYYWAIIVTAIVGTGVFLIIKPVQQIDNWLICISWLCIYIFADYFEAQIKLGKRDDVVLTITEAITIFLIIVSAEIGILITIIGTFIADRLNERTLYSSSFNIAQRSLIYIILYGVFLAVSVEVHDFVAFAIIGILHYIFDVAIVCTMIALASRRSWLDVFINSYFQTLFVHCVTLPIGICMAIMWSISPLTVIFGFIPLVSAQKGFEIIARLATKTTIMNIAGVIQKSKSGDEKRL